MIDFRYHLVSIVSIFLALAVGIVLGAGPLKEDIGNTLTSEVTKLREDKATAACPARRGRQGRPGPRRVHRARATAALLAGRLQDTT